MNHIGNMEVVVLFTPLKEIFALLVKQIKNMIVELIRARKPPPELME